MKENSSTTIWIKTQTKELLDKAGRKGETYDDIIRKLIDKEKNLLGLDLRNRRLYRQGVDARPCFVIPYTDAFKFFGKKSSIAWFYGRKNYSYWDEDVVTDIARNILLKQIKEGNYINKLIKEWNSRVDKQINFEKEITDLTNKSNAEIVQLTHKLAKITHGTWEVGINIEVFDPKSEELIEEILNKYDTSNLSIKEFKILCSSKESTYIQKEM